MRLMARPCVLLVAPNRVHLPLPPAQLIAILISPVASQLTVQPTGILMSQLWAMLTLSQLHTLTWQM